MGRPWGRCGSTSNTEQHPAASDRTHSERETASSQVTGRVGDSAKEEASVDREAARWAIPIAALTEAWRGDPCPAEVADRLKTTEALLRIRLDALHPAERGYIERRLAAREDAA